MGSNGFSITRAERGCLYFGFWRGFGFRFLPLIINNCISPSQLSLLRLSLHRYQRVYRVTKFERTRIDEKWDFDTGNQVHAFTAVLADTLFVHGGVPASLAGAGGSLRTRADLAALNGAFSKSIRVG